MLAHKFFKLFPPPSFLNIPYAGLDISDDAIRCIEFHHAHGHGLYIRRYGMRTLPVGTILDGEIRDEKTLIDTLRDLSKDLGVHVVKASLPEEKIYLFKTAVPSVDIKEMRQNIEFKLEENVPLTNDESLFFFDLIPKAAGVTIEEPEKANNPVGVSVAPKSVVLSYLSAIKAAGITVTSFDVDAKGLARAIVPKGYTGTDLIVHMMNKKTGLYIVVGGVVCFTSTLAWGSESNVPGEKPNFSELKKSILQVKNYWREHGLGTQIERVVFVGKGALAEGLINECSLGFTNPHDGKVKFEIAKIWQNAFSPNTYIPPIPYDDSLDYGVAAGLALI